MARTWLVDSRAIARKVKNAGLSPSLQIKDSGAKRECPSCSHLIDNSDVCQEWPGLPAGVKFDPSDVELLEHLAAKCGVGSCKPHKFIDEFIPTIQLEEGICYTHPQNLPGAKKDGSKIHFFHRTSNAYATGQRKRRKIQNQHGLIKEDVRWHKTGKTKAIMDSNVQKGWKKIMVLYKSAKKGCKADKSGWVMHQYHLGTEDDEKDGDIVVSKIFYDQEKQIEKNSDILCVDDCDAIPLHTSPRTPKTITPDPPRAEKYLGLDDFAGDGIVQSSSQAIVEAKHEADEEVFTQCLAGESQALDDYDLNNIEDSLLCKELIESCSQIKEEGRDTIPHNSLAEKVADVTRLHDAPCGISDLENLDFDTPPDFLHPELPFGSQESIFDWLDRI